MSMPALTRINSGPPGLAGWGMLAAEWSLAAVGILLVAIGRARSDWRRTILYLCMAWGVGLIGMQAIARALPGAGGGDR